MVLKTKSATLLVLISAMLSIWGCERSSDDIPTGVPMDIENLIDSGWDYFEAGNYSAAIDDFGEASSRDALEAEAYLGLGWSYLRDGQFNLAISSVYSVSLPINLGIITDPSVIAMYNSESYACLAGAYGGLYAADIPTYAPLVVQYVDMTLDIDPGFEFTHDSAVDRQALLVAKADAQYALTEFADAFYTISGVDASLMNNTAIVQNIQDQSILVQTLFDSTSIMGYARLTVPSAQFIDIYRITDDADTNSVGDFIEYSIGGYSTGGNQVTFYGTPVPETGDYFLVSYYNAVDYVSFLIGLRTLIDNYR